MYSLLLRKSVEEYFHKISRKNPRQFAAIEKKTKEILLKPHHYKNLRAPLNHLKSVHINKSFVLVYSVNEENKTVTLEEIDHHDKIYK